jgi:hypothetical protein
MSDLNGNWSAQFIESLVGQQLIGNMVSSLFPLKRIESNEIIVKAIEDNYTTQLFVDAHTTETDKVEVAVVPVSAEAIAFYQDKPIVINSFNAGTTYEFDLTCSGVYEIVVTRKSLNVNQEWEISAQKSFYKTFTYSKEYDIFPDEEEITSVEYLQTLADDGRGIFVEEPFDVFDSFSKTIEKVFDPRWLFAIMAMTLFLLDVAVRKFKWKWPHEIIRERREKQRLAK